MPLARTTRATMIALGLAALVFAVAMIAHASEQNDSEIVRVPLDPADPSRTRIGQLEYLGGLDIPPMGQNIGGLSGLRWDPQSGRLLAITDDARWVWMTPVEEGGRLSGIGAIEVGDLLGLDGEPLSGKEQADSESLTYYPREKGWFIGFERDHRVLLYLTLEATPVQPDIDPVAMLGEMESNNGLEAMAGNNAVQLVCAERQANEDRPNCFRSVGDGGRPFAVSPPDGLRALGGVPTDADILADGTAFVLFRSYSPQDGSGSAIVAYGPGDERREIVVLRPPLTVDNFEGLAVREEGEGEGRRTFLYIVSDDNFSSSQRTLLMKFEVLSPEISTQM